jgi:hypothetical protein
MKKKANETVGQAWMRELPLVSIDADDAAAFHEACRAVLAINPMLAMDDKALHFPAQDWLAAMNQAAVAV